jgi:hypothetical protein
MLKSKGLPTELGLIKRSLCFFPEVILNFAGPELGIPIPIISIQNRTDEGVSYKVRSWLLSRNIGNWSGSGSTCYQRQLKAKPMDLCPERCLRSWCNRYENNHGALRAQCHSRSLRDWGRTQPSAQKVHQSTVPAGGSATRRSHKDPL